MVRFKNRHLLVEFLQPSSLGPTFSTTPGPVNLDASNENDDEGEEDDDEELIVRPPDIPFLLPLPNADGTKPRLRLGDEGGGAIFKQIRSVVQDVYGDEGWGRIASSFKVIYHSPLTTLTIIRVSRSHYRLLWSAVTLMTTVNGQPVLPRVVAVSGTIKKLQNAAIVYHRNVTGQVLAVAMGEADGPTEKAESKRKLEKGWEGERTDIGSLQD